MIEIKANRGTDRENLITALTNLGYCVQVEHKKQKYDLGSGDYYVQVMDHFDISTKVDKINGSPS